jgi:hypothetical protein
LSLVLSARTASESTQGRRRTTFNHLPNPLEAGEYNRTAVRNAFNVQSFRGLGRKAMLTHSNWHDPPTAHSSLATRTSTGAAFMLPADATTAAKNAQLMRQTPASAGSITLPRGSHEAL